MSLTSPFCPSVDDIVMDVKMACWSVTGINSVDVDITFTPEWGPDKMSEDAKLILGID
jgi:metal-sulfur cluster biosynthetic enzyme